VQTQCIYDMDRFERWMQGVRERGLHEKIHIMAGVTPLKSAGMANYMNNKVSGISVPDEIIQRIKGVPKEKQAEEGIKLCVEQINHLKSIEGVHGIHLMAIEWEHRVPEIMEAAGLLPRPKPE
jgi:methylenetetrahydrofolate reductase (NADPH)